MAGWFSSAVDAAKSVGKAAVNTAKAGWELIKSPQARKDVWDDTVAVAKEIKADAQETAADTAQAFREAKVAAGRALSAAADSAQEVAEDVGDAIVEHGPSVAKKALMLTPVGPAILAAKAAANAIEKSDFVQDLKKGPVSPVCNCPLYAPSLEEQLVDEQSESNKKKPPVPSIAL